MRFDNETRARITLTVTTDFDPAAATIELGIDDAWHPVTWTGAATAITSSGKWTRRAQTDDYFAGPDVTPAGAVILTVGRHPTQTRVTNGGDTIVAASTPIDVR